MNKSKEFRKIGVPLILFLMMLTLSMCFLTGCRKTDSSNQSDEASANSYVQISSEDAMAIMESEDGYIILDVRTPEEYKEGHIPNAVNVDVETIGNDLPSELPDLDQLIMVYCRSGNRSKQASEKLVNLGYTNIVEFGGIIDWSGDVVTD